MYILSTNPCCVAVSFSTLSPCLLTCTVLLVTYFSLCFLKCVWLCLVLLRHMGSRCGLSSGSLWTRLLCGTCLVPWPRIKPTSPALAGRFLPSVPAGKSPFYFDEGKFPYGLCFLCVKNALVFNFSLKKSYGLEEEMATHSSILAWRIPWTGEPGSLQSMGSQRAGHNLATTQIQKTN